VEQGELSPRSWSGVGEPVRRLPTARIADKPTIVSAGQDGTIRQWDMASGQGDWRAKSRASGGVHAAVARTYGVSGTADSSLIRWDLCSGRRLGPFHSRPFTWVAHMAVVLTAGDAQIVVSTGLDGLIPRWNLVEGKEIGEPRTPPKPGDRCCPQPG